MDIGLKEIEYIANLSRIALTDEEKKTFKKQLANILDYIKKLNELNTDTVEPMAYATDLKNVFRKEELTPSLSRQKILNLSPSNVNGFFKVPKVIE
ncbi:MAG: Asp-tRNA(Asn)/Glu-tRNA(Gln) amidotransferase subunit GatC [Candidatus Scalindua sediminis]